MPTTTARTGNPGDVQRARVTIELSIEELEMLEDAMAEAGQKKLARRLTLCIPGLQNNLNRAYRKKKEDEPTLEV